MRGKCMIFSRMWMPVSSLHLLLTLWICYSIISLHFTCISVSDVSSMNDNLSLTLKKKSRSHLFLHHENYDRGIIVWWSEQWKCLKNALCSTGQEFPPSLAQPPINLFYSITLKSIRNVCCAFKECSTVKVRLGKFENTGNTCQRFYNNG